MKLQRVRRSFDDVDSLGRIQMRTLKRLARDLGAVCIPLCVRELGHDGEAVERSRWASALLLDLGRSEHGDAVSLALEELVARMPEGSPARLRALGLLADLGQPLPAGAGLQRSATEVERSIRELTSQLTDAAGVARVGDTLARLMPAHEMLVLVDALCTNRAEPAVLLIAELLLRNDLEEPVRRQLKRMYAELRTGDGPVRAPGGQPVATAVLGRHADGSRAVVAWRLIERRAPGVCRALSLVIDGQGSLVRGDYRDDLSTGGPEREMLEPLRRRGYQLETVSRADAAQLVIRAGQAAHRLGRTLPRSFFLGRDLLQIYDQHTAGLVLQQDLSSILDRAYMLSSAGHQERARSLFERFIAQVPDRADGHAGLAMCLMALDEPTEALKHLHRAAWLEPNNANHHWNLAAVAYRQNRVGGCYLALVEYLAHAGADDEAPGDAAERRELAVRFVSEYERIARLEYPEVTPAQVADVDERLLRAWECVRTGAHAQAVSALQYALDTVPSHYPTLACLGLACTELGRLEQARDYVHQSLALRPGYPLATEVLERVEQLLEQAHNRTPKRPLRRSATSLEDHALEEQQSS